MATNSTTTTTSLQPENSSAQAFGLSPYQEAKERKHKMVRKLLYLGFQMGYDEPRTPAQTHMNRSQRNLTNVQAWCLSDKCVIRKTFKKYSVEELTQVLTQFEAVYASFEKQYNKAG